MKTRTRGTTLIEIMVVTVILTFVAFGLYQILKEANHKRAFSESRALASREAAKILALMQNDISQAKLGSVKIKADGNLELAVRVGDNSEKPLKYRISPPFLNRDFDGKTWLVTQWLEGLNVTKVDNATGQYVVDLKTNVALDGLLKSESQKHNQTQMIVCREDMASQNDPYWRDAGHMNTFFSTQGSLVDGLKEDANQVVQNFETAAKDIENMGKDATIGQLEKAKTGLLKGISDLKSQLSSMNTRIINLDPESVFDMGGGALSRMWGSASGRTDRLKAKAEQIKQALSRMNKSSEMNWSAIENIAGSDAGRLRDTARSMFDGKKQLFDAGSQIVETLDKFKIQVTIADGVDRSVWGANGG